MIFESLANDSNLLCSHFGQTTDKKQAAFPVTRMYLIYNFDYSPHMHAYVPFFVQAALSFPSEAFRLFFDYAVKIIRAQNKMTRIINGRPDQVSGPTGPSSVRL
jgi:hypothetical protein